jgi:hypothetical protein
MINNLFQFGPSPMKNRAINWIYDNSPDSEEPKGPKSNRYKVAV